MNQRLHSLFHRQSLAGLALEVAVVILGILIAFQIDRWAEERRDRQLEQDYLVRLKEDLEIEIRRMDASLGYAQSRLEAAALLEAVAAEPERAAERPAAVPLALETATWRSFPQIDAFVYSELQATGNLSLLRSEALRRMLAEHYASMRDHARVGYDLALQRHFDQLTAGILTTDELVDIENESWHARPYETRSERAVAVARALAERPAAVALIPGIAQHHVFNRKVIESSRSRAIRIIAEIDRLAAGD